MSQGKHFSFESLPFEEVIAHNGIRPIYFHRASQKQEVGSYNFLDFTILPVGTDIGIHTHESDNEEIYVIISGRGRMYLDGDLFDVEAGHVIVNRPGGTHGLKNIGDEELKIVVVEVPFPAQSQPQGLKTGTDSL